MGLFSGIGSILKGALPVVGGLLGGPLGGLAGGALGGLLGGKKKAPAGPPGTPIGSLPGTGLDDQFTQAISDERDRRNTLNKGLDTSLGGLDSAIASEEGMHASATDGFDPSTGHFDPSATKGVDTSGVTNFDPSATRGVDLSGVNKFKSTNLEGFDPSSLDNFAGGGAGGHSANEGFTPEGFDAGASVKEYSRGALDDATQSIKDQLYSLQGKNASAGRLDTGYFDRDRGEVIDRVSRGFANSVTDKAVQAAGITGQYRANADNARERAGEGVDTFRTAGSGQRLSALQSAAQLRFNRAGGIDSNALDAAKSGASLGLDQAGTIDKTRLEALTAGTGLALDRGKTIDSLGLDAAKSADSLNLNKAEFGDTFRQNNAQFGVNARQNATNTRAGLSENSSNRYLDALSGGLDRAQGAKNAKAAAGASKTNGILGLLGGVASSVLPKLLKKGG